MFNLLRIGSISENCRRGTCCNNSNGSEMTWETKSSQNFLSGISAENQSNLALRTRSQIKPLVLPETIHFQDLYCLLDNEPFSRVLYDRWCKISKSSMPKASTISEAAASPMPLKKKPEIIFQSYGGGLSRWYFSDLFVSWSKTCHPSPLAFKYFESNDFGITVSTFVIDLSECDLAQWFRFCLTLVGRFRDPFLGMTSQPTLL